MNTDNGVQQLESYVLNPDAFHGDAIPKRLQRDVVAGFVVERVGRDTGFKSLVRVDKLVTFYDLQEVCGHLSSLLPPSPAPTEVAKAAVIGRTIAATCRPAEVQRVARYSALLIANAQSSSEIAELLELQDRLGLGADSRVLEARINQLLDRIVATLRQSLKLAAAQGALNADADFAAHADLLLSFTLGRWHRFVKSNFKEEPMRHWAALWPLLSGQCP